MSSFPIQVFDYVFMVYLPQLDCNFLANRRYSGRSCCTNGCGKSEITVFSSLPFSVPFPELSRVVLALDLFLAHCHF